MYSIYCLQLLSGKLPAGVQENGYFLHMENAMMSHEGQYTCVVTNSAGEDKKDFYVTVQGWFVAACGTLSFFTTTAARV